MGTTVRLEITDRVATVTIDRPDALNAIDESVLTGLREAVDAVTGDVDVKAVVVRGTGDRAFCVGLDLDLLGRAFDDPDYFASVVTRLGDILSDLEALPVPVVAAVGGLARAGGFELILACDLVIVADEARIGDTHVGFGLLPGGGASARAPRRMLPAFANALLLGGAWLEGPEAVVAGLAVRCVPRAELDEAVEALVKPMRHASRAATAATKALLRDGAELGSGDALQLELDRFVDFIRHEPTSREGYDAFVEQRRAKFD